MIPSGAIDVGRGDQSRDPNVTLRIDSVSKAYGATVALRDVALDVRSGEIHALLGENGAGKSTLVKILNGIVVPDAGSIALDGVDFRPRSVIDARAAGVATAFQELSLLPNLTVATNLALPRLHGVRAARATLGALEAGGIEPDALVGDLSLAQRQQVEIVRALRLRPRLLVLDEPTAALAHPEWLFRRLETIAAAGTAILYITHRLADVRRLCARATVLRNGVNVATVEVAATSDARFFAMMVGGDQVSRIPIAHAGAAARAARLAVKRLAAPGIEDISFTLTRGEILGVAALEGQGQRSLFRVLGGSLRATHGTIEVDGEPVVLASTRAAQRAGIGALPEDRKTEGIFAGLATGANVSLPILGRLRQFLMVDRARERSAVTAAAAEVELGERTLDRDIAQLSGGNQQKALLARVVISDARTLVLFDPTRGVDVGTKQVIYDLLRRFAARGGSVLVYSSELSELVEFADRCIVLYRGRIAGELAGEALSEAGLIALATGPSAGAHEPEAVRERRRGARVAARYVNGTAIAFALYVVLFAICALRQPDTLSVSGITDLFNNALPLAVAAAGSALVVLTRNFDLSVAGVVALTNVLIATVIPDGAAARLEGALLAIGVGTVTGAVNGIFVAYLGLQSVATTLGTMIVCSGLALLVLNAPGGSVPRAISDALTGDLGVVPVAAIVAAAILIAWSVVRRSDWGVALYAVGADETAAQLAGIRTRKTKLIAFCVAGALYGIAGYLLSAVTTTGDPNAGNTYLILTYAAVAIGGVSFSGGYGGLLGAMIGAATLSLLQKVLFSIGVVSFYTGIAQGVAMILAVLVGGLSVRLAAARAA